MAVRGRARRRTPLTRPPSAIESIYSERLFPFFQIILTSISNRVAFALFDVLVIAAIDGAMAPVVDDVIADI